MTRDGADDLEECRTVLIRCREAAIERADQAIRELMEYNSTTLKRIDAAIATLEPSPGEPVSEHRCRILAAITDFHLLTLREPPVRPVGRWPR